MSSKWVQVRKEYERGDWLKDICARHNVSLSGIQNHRSRYQWSKDTRAHGREKLLEERAKRIRELYERSPLTKKEIAAREGVSPSYITMLCRTQSWKPRQKGWKGWQRTFA